MLEPVRRLTREARLGGPDEVLRRECLEVGVDGGAGSWVDEGDDRAAVEDLALDRAPFQGCACAGLERVEACAEECVEARRQGERIEVAEQARAAVIRPEGALVTEHRDELLEEERVPSRRCREPRAQRRRCTSEHDVEQPFQVLCAEGLQSHRRVPVRTHLDELRAGQPENHDGRGAERRRQAGEEIEQRRLRPLDVVDDHHQRPLPGARREKGCDRTRGVLGGGRPACDAEQQPDVRGDRRRLLRSRDVRFQQREHLVRRVLVPDAGQLARDLAHGPVRDSLAVREARPADDAGARADPRDELGDQAGLADARLAQDGGKAGGPGRDDLVEYLLEAVEVLGSARERRPRRPRDRPEACDLEQAIRGHRLGLPLRLERLDRLDAHRVAHEAEGRLAEQHVARARGLLEPCSDVDRVAGHERLAARAVARDDLAGVDADPQGDACPEALLEILVQGAEARLHLQCGAARAQRIVLVRLRDAEDREDGVADELLHRAAVTLERAAHLVEVGEHQAADRLRIEALAHRGRARQVTEDKRCELPALRVRRVRGRCRSSCRSAPRRRRSNHSRDRSRP